MKRMIISLVIGAILLSGSRAAAGPLLSELGVLYYAEYRDTWSGYPGGPEPLSGGIIMVYLGTVAGVDETDIKSVQVTHTRTNGEVRKYTWSKPVALEPWSLGNYMERFWALRLSPGLDQVGQWRFRINPTTGKQFYEARTVTVDYFCYPPKPSNMAMQVQGDTTVRIEWAASAGPPQWYDSAYNADYWIRLFGDHPTAQEEVQADQYDPDTNRVAAIVPAGWRGQRIRIENRVLDGGIRRRMPGGLSSVSVASQWATCR
jgi:hypothetical protein